MLGVRLFAQMEKHFGKHLPLASLFQAPTVEHLATLLREKKTLSSCSSLVSIQPKGTRPPIFFVHGAGGGNLWTYANLAPHLGPDQPVYGLESRGMRGLEEFTRIEDMAAHYIEEIRRHVFRSEEHTSELQSQSNLVCRLLLEKKNNYRHLSGKTPDQRGIYGPGRSRTRRAGNHHRTHNAGVATSPAAGPSQTEPRRQ